MTAPVKILVCDDNPVFQLHLKRTLNHSFDLVMSHHGDEALQIIKEHRIDLVLLDIQLRSAMEGIQYIPKLLAADPELTIIMISSTTDFRIFKEAMKLGAVDYIAKDFSTDEMNHTIFQAIERRSLLKRQQQQNFESLNTQRHHVLLGESHAIQDLRKKIEKIRASSAHVLITGETGTGKELVARQLRKSFGQNELEPFVSIDSSTIQSSMAESILFGHEKGAFTGADRINKGLFEEAHQGAVYFDELANMTLEIQAKLLRVIQEKEVRRLGSARSIKLEFRVICATNKDIEQMIQQGQFKDDLYQRLNVIPLTIPPLRERPEDIPLLVNHFLTQQMQSIPRPYFSEAALEALKTYTWPGNVRELGNTIAYVATLFEGEEIGVADLPPKLRESIRKQSMNCPGLRTNPETMESKPFYQRVEDFEREILIREISQNDGSISKLALSLGMDRSHLYTKLKEYGLRPSRALS
jgi:two-component system nitrogen regulation response regulator NtrX